jgi:hypothetical protein
MHGFVRFVCESRGAENLTRCDPRARCDIGLAEVGNRRPQVAAMVNGHGQHPRHRAGERDRSVAGSADWGPDIGM